MEQLSLPHAHTVVVTVTYGDRFPFLQQVVDGAFANDVAKVVIVDNGSATASRQAVRTLERDSNGRIAVVALAENRGSAAGFKAGLEYAVGCSDCEYIWLLDDDNRPAENALAELLRHQSTLCRATGADRLALACVRQRWSNHVQLLQGVPPSRILPRKSSFMGFHLRNQPRRMLELLYLDRAAARDGAITSPIELPLAAYGGLFFHRSLLSNVGYPDERFFLYHDDSEYTYRLTARGGKIFLIPSSVIVDLERSWHLPSRGETLFSRLLIADSDFRCYYATRNQAYLDKHHWTTNRLAYRLNKWAFFAILFVFALGRRKWRRFALIARATRDGELERLGRAGDMGNP